MEPERFERTAQPVTISWRFVWTLDAAGEGRGLVWVGFWILWLRLARTFWFGFVGFGLVRTFRLGLVRTFSVRLVEFGLRTLRFGPRVAAEEQRTAGAAWPAEAST